MFCKHGRKNSCLLILLGLSNISQFFHVMNLFLKKSGCFSRKIVPFPGEFVKVITEKYAIFRIYLARELTFCLEI